MDDETETVKFQTKALRAELDVHPKFFLNRYGVIKYDVGLLLTVPSTPACQTPVDHSLSAVTREFSQPVPPCRVPLSAGIYRRQTYCNKYK